MADSGGGCEGDHLRGGATSFSQLLFADDEDAVGLEMGQTCSFPGFYGEKPPKMLCFGGYQSEGEVVVFSDQATKTTPQKSGITCSTDSSSASSGTNCSSANTVPNSNKKQTGSGQESVQLLTTKPNTRPATNQRSSKKTRTDNPTSKGHAKVRRESLGERITTLQQLVSPFGKTDTASVLHEAMGYIRFLQDQVQVLCSPYLQHPTEGGGGGGDEEPGKDLRSRGLCLVPVSCTMHVASSNGADFWSPAMGSNILSSSTKR